MLNKFIKKMLIFFIFYCLMFIVSSCSPILAEAPLTREEWSEIVGDNNKEYTLEDNNQQVYNNLLNSMLDSIIGNSSISGQVGALKSLNQPLAFLITQPAVSTSEYLADLSSSLGLETKPTYAATGIGWNALTPVLQLWKAFRNLAYLGFVFIFIIIGFMIMFRTKINPQTVITIQEALPRIVITLLLVTFSYAIAGLMIDFIYILIYLIVGLFSLQGLINNTDVLTNDLFNKSLFNLMNRGTIFHNQFASSSGKAINTIIGNLTGSEIINSIIKFFGNSNLIGIIIGFALLINVLKIFFSLLMSYIGIIVSVIFAPINLLFNALPGNNTFSSWLKGLLGNILPFPVIALMFLLAAVLIGAPANVTCEEGILPENKPQNPWCVVSPSGYSNNSNNNLVWVPPFLNLGGDLGGVNPFTPIISLGILFLMPKAVEMVKKTLKVEEGAMAAGIPAILGGVMAPVRLYQSYKQYRQEQASKDFTKLQIKKMKGETEHGQL